MVFSSLSFLFVFLPISVIGYHLLNKHQLGRLSLSFLFFMSVVFYAYWKPFYACIVLVSILVNYTIGQWLIDNKTHRKAIFITGLGINLGALAYYKYTDFAISSINTLMGTHMPLQHVLLPIGISFFTFQQLAYLVDIYTGAHQPDKGLVNYSLFVCFFPQLIAGPIVHHQEMMPQFAAEENRRLDWDNMYAGMVLLCLGLAKKVLFADMLSPVVKVAFDDFTQLTFFEAWLGSLAYSLQLYFDFSAYSDMALGCGLFFNIRLPHNFFSPYKSRNIQDFWRRWHITLSRWLRSYLYIPLGGSRRSEGRVLCNLFITFFLGGLWHGAAWTFVVWGALHGCALIVHRLWGRCSRVVLPGLVAWGVTFLFVNAAWVVFRATSFGDALKVYSGMLGLNGFKLTHAFKDALFFQWGEYRFSYVIVRAGILLLLLVAWLAPNSLQIVGAGKPSRVKTAWALAAGVLAVCMLSLPERVTEFIYFQF